MARPSHRCKKLTAVHPLPRSQLAGPFLALRMKTGGMQAMARKPNRFGLARSCDSGRRVARRKAGMRRATARRPRLNGA